MFWKLIRKQFKSVSVISGVYTPQKLVPKTISYYTLEINFKDNYKCKCNQNGNEFQNNLRVRVFLVHPTVEFF